MNVNGINTTSGQPLDKKIFKDSHQTIILNCSFQFTERHLDLHPKACRPLETAVLDSYLFWGGY